MNLIQEFSKWYAIDCLSKGILPKNLGKKQKLDQNKFGENKKKKQIEQRKLFMKIIISEEL